jgi:hypothetical protein
MVVNYENALLPNGASSLIAWIIAATSTIMRLYAKVTCHPDVLHQTFVIMVVENTPR